MLVHKLSRGVLACIEVPGASAGPWRKLRNLKLSMFPDLNPNDWWEVRDTSQLGIRLIMYYPDFIPVTDDNGALIDLKPIERIKEPEVTPYVHPTRKATVLTTIPKRRYKRS